MKSLTSQLPDLHLELPTWVADYLSKASEQTETPEQRMAFVVSLARMNIQHGSGGPFAAAVFRLDTHALVAPGVNLVVSSRCSVAHAEIMALTLAEQVVGSHDLGTTGLPGYELVTSCEPCTMCLGAIVWSGIRQIICGAQETDASEIGFDEGPKPLQWVSDLQQRGITIIQDIQRAEARQVLQDYAKQGGMIYNGRPRTS
ncbi:MAG: nucleoside deaminase [Nitrospirales bacterium]|nr:nucleoside deaminase [Nitrospirales bacterium]